MESDEDEDDEDSLRDSDSDDDTTSALSHQMKKVMGSVSGLARFPRPRPHSSNAQQQRCCSNRSNKRLAKKEAHAHTTKTVTVRQNCHIEVVALTEPVAAPKLSPQPSPALVPEFVELPPVLLSGEVFFPPSEHQNDEDNFYVPSLTPPNLSPSYCALEDAPRLMEALILE